MDYHFEMELPPWMYNSIMGGPVNYHIGHLSPRFIMTWRF